MRNTIHTEKITFKKINKRLVILILVLIILFFVSQILVTSILGTKTQEIDIIRNQKESLRLQNEILTSEIDKLKSVSSAGSIQEKYDLVEKNLTFLEDGSNDDVALR